MSRFGLWMLGCMLFFAVSASAEEYTLNFHRGGGNSRPENTLETFLWAWNQGIIPEGDVQYTKDGVPVMFHDGKLNRLPWGLSDDMKKKRIADYNWDVVRTLDVGRYKGEAYANQRIPTLESVFAAMSHFPQRLFYLDEKGLTVENQKEIAEMARRFQIEEQLFFTSGQYEKILQWHAICPEAKAMLWLGYCWTKEGRCNMEGLNKALDELRAADFAGVTHLNVHILTNFDQADPFSPDSEYLRKLAAEMKERGIPFQVITWTQGDNPETYKRLLKLGLTGFATDFPEVLLQEVPPKP